MADIKRKDVLTYLETANMLEISELIKDIEEKFGVTAAAPVAIAGGAAPAEVANAGAGEEKTEFDVELSGVGDKKINVTEYRERYLKPHTDLEILAFEEALLDYAQYTLLWWAMYPIALIYLILLILEWG